MNIKEYPLKGFRTLDIEKIPDERGSFAEVLRRDYKDFVNDDSLEQVNLSFSYPNVVRGWHRHQRGQVDYFLTIKGAMKICAYDDKSMHLVEAISSEEKLRIVRVPGLYWHATKTVSPKPSLTLYFTTRLYDYKNPDEERRDWNSKLICPEIINGNKEDSRAGRPWDWFTLPNK